MARQEAGGRAARERLRRAMQREGFAVEQIVREFGVRWGFRPRQAWRHVRGMTQDEVAAEFNEALGDPRAPMSGKRISDFEAWPTGGVKPTVQTLSVLARLYGTQVHMLVDFADFEAMTRAERVALRATDPAAARVGAVPESVSASSIGDFADVAAGWGAYVRCCVGIVERGTYYCEEIDELLATLSRVIAALVCREVAWLDVVVPVQNPPSSGAAAPVADGVISEVGWLQVWASGVRRTTRPSLIPIQVNEIPWRGSGNAFLSRGIDYVGSFRGLYARAEYGLAPKVVSQIESRYDYWREECYFAALLAVAIRSPEPGVSDAVGVLNVNFTTENPVGDNDTLEPQRSAAILDILEPALRLISKAIARHQPKDRTA